MPTTKLREDKYAFLFAGTSSGILSDRYRIDLENFYQTLIDYYNYPASNIYIVQGANAFSGTFPGLNPTHMLTVSTRAEFESDFISFAESLIATYKEPDPGGDPLKYIINPGAANLTVVAYFTGESTDSGATAKMVIKGAETADIDQLSTLFQTPYVFMVNTNPSYLGQCQFNVIVDQNSAFDFSGTMTGGSSGIGMLNNYSFSYSCGTGGASLGDDINGSTFTKSLVAGLRQNEVLITGKFADELDPGCAKLQITLNGAVEYAKIKSSDLTYGNINVGDAYKYLGCPDFMIRDGAPYWWESPDIFLHHPNHPAKADSDLYVPDDLSASSPFNNIINVKVRNIGTHPVRSYAIFIELFRSGLGYMNNKLHESNHMPVGGILKPVQKTNIDTASDVFDRYEWDTPFYMGVTHECIRAEAQLEDTLIDEAWDVTVNDFEAQRNTDVSGDPPAPEGSDLRKLPGNRFRGITRHMYFIQNPFKETHQFLVAFPFDYKKHLRVIKMNWLTYGRGNREEKIKLIDIDKKTKGFLFTLKKDESKPVIFEFGFRYDTKLPKIFRIPLEILVDRIHGQKTRKPIHKALHDKFAAIAGLTVVLERAVAHLAGTVLEKNGKPVAHATIHLSSINGLQKETFKTGRNGKFYLEAINPDIYKIEIQSEGKKIKEHVICLIEPKKLEIKFHLENLPKVQVIKKKK